MQLEKIMMRPKLKLIGLVLLALPIFSLAQENSVYSRYGIGNLTPQGNILNRGMGGLSAGFSDAASINFLNPASYADLRLITLDLALQVDSRTMVQQSPSDKFTSNNAFVPYLQLGIPLYSPWTHPNKKATLQGFSWAANVGLRPLSKINYKIENFNRLQGIDSLSTVYEGTGGLNQAYIGTGVRFKNISFGVNVGYTFGRKNYSTKLEFINDTVNYIKTNSADNTQLGGLFVNGGIMYTDTLKHKAFKLLKIGAYGNIGQNLKATKDIVRESFIYNTSGGTSSLDSVYKAEQTGKLKMPATFGIGFTISNAHLLTGLDFETTSWGNYEFFEQKDFVQNSWTLKGGFQYYSGTGKKYLDFIKYRAGIYYGKDYINIDNNMPLIGITAGMGLPIQRRQYFADRRSAEMNFGIDYSARGNKKNNVRENILRISVGFSLSDLWFRRYKYD
jgi:hypothetical protein